MNTSNEATFNPKVLIASITSGVIIFLIIICLSVFLIFKFRKAYSINIGKEDHINLFSKEGNGSEI